MRYVSDNVISFSIRINGKDSSKRVSFIPCSTGGSNFFTTNEALIEALEKSSMFGNVYRRAPECVKNADSGKKKTVKEEVQKKTVPVEGWQDAAEYLTENFGVDSSKLNTPTKIAKVAEANGIEFTIKE